MPLIQNVAQFTGGPPPIDEHPTVGGLLREAGKLSVADAERVSSRQKAENLRFGETALRLGLITEADLQQALARQFSYHYLAPGEGSFSRELVAVYQPFGRQSENLRALRSQLMLRWFANGRRALTVAGIHAGDGASYLAANLAIVFAQLGQRTLLVDADLRSPRQHALFNLGHRAGLSDLLARRASSAAAVVHLASIPNLAVLTAGAVPPNPGELLSGAALPAQLDAFAQDFDVILLDTSAADDSADAAMVAARSRGALLVLRQDHTRLAAAAAFQSNLVSAGAALIGTVLNAF